MGGGRGQRGTEAGQRGSGRERSLARLKEGEVEENDINVVGSERGGRQLDKAAAAG